MERSITKEAVPVFYNEKKEPVAVLLFINGHRIIYSLNEASEEDITNLYGKTNQITILQQGKGDTNNTKDTKSN